MPGALLLGLVVLGLDWLCGQVPRETGVPAPIWLGNAVVLAALLRSRRSSWTILSTAGALAHFVANLMVGDGPALALGLALCGTLESAGAATVLVHFLGRQPDMSRARNLALYATVTAVGALASAGLAAVLTTHDAGSLAKEIAIRGMADWTALLVVTPSLVALAVSWRTARSWSAHDRWAFAFAAALVLLAFLQSGYPLTFLAPPALLLITWRTGLPGAALAILATLLLAVAATIAGRGPFALMDAGVTGQMLVLQAFLVVCFYASIPVAAQAERSRSMQARLTRALTRAREQARKVAEKEAQLEVLTSHAPDMLVQIGPDDTLVYASPAARRFGYDPSDLVGRRRSDFVHPDDLERLNRILLATDAGERTAQAERQYRIRHANGEWVWVEGSLSLVHDDTGAIVGAVSLLRDISERRAAAAALAESEARYRTLADNVTDIIVRFGPDGLIRYISPACRALGVDPEAAVGRPVMDVVAPRHRSEVEQHIAALFSGAQLDPLARRVFEVAGPDGEPLWLEGSPTPIRNEAGQVVEVVSTLRDVTAREQMETALAESEGRFRQLAENANDLIMRSDVGTGAITYISPSCRKVAGYAPEDVIGRSALDFIHPDDHPALNAAVADQIASRGQALPRTVEFRLRTASGEHIWVEAKPTAVVDPASGRVLAITDVTRDITEHKAMETELRAARAEAERAAQAKSEFLANMSHELRTPLTSVVGFTKLAAEQQDLSPITRGYIERVDQAARALLCAVNDILDFSKLEAGEVTFHAEAVCLPKLARSALELFMPQAGAKDLELAFDADGPDDLTLLLDPDRFRQVLLNLVGNAVKFTADGGVTLRADYDDARQELQVEVRDTGAGIPADRLDRLFKRFSQVDGSLTRAHGGTGLGLAICKGIVEAQGGTIGVRSRVGEGSVFSFTIPAQRLEAANTTTAEEQAPQVTFAGMRVLVVDDHPANRELVRLFLTGLGAEVSDAADGVEAAELAGDWPYDLILMDLRMPRLDGAGALARIRSAPGPNDATPILAFTADADPELRERLQSLGFDGLVAKPVSPAALISAVAQATACAPDTHLQELRHVA